MITKLLSTFIVSSRICEQEVNIISDTGEVQVEGKN